MRNFYQGVYMFSANVLRFMTTALLALCIASAAQAASLSISPVIITLDAKKQTAALTLRNEGNEARVLQAELLRWTQKDGENVHTPSRDILVNPPIVTLRPGQSQIIRVGLNRKVDKAQELAYRLYVSEVPPPPKEGFSGLRIALRLGVPVFVSPQAKPSTHLDWKALRGADGALQLTLLNSGNSHLRLNGVRISDAGTGEALAESQQSQVTLLAGQARQFPLSLPAKWQGKLLSVIASTEEGLVESKVALEQLTK